jgi:gliding motility-associated protein GldM
MLPLASVITLLSKMQADVRNAEAEMINYLLAQITEGDVNFNALRAVVIPDRSVVFPGEEYRARVFLAAYDSTNAPEVQLEDGTMLAIEGGEGIYTTNTGSLGFKTWGGTIKLDNNGQVIERPFKETYEVAQANATVSATAMNVFYRGLNNPVAISAGNVAESSVRVSISSPHSIRRNGPGDYTVKPGPQGDEATVTVFAEINGVSKRMTQQKFRVKDLPTPTATITGSKAGKANLTVGQLTSLDKVRAEPDEGFEFEVEFVVESFTVGFFDSNNIWNEKAATSANFNSEQKQIFRNLRSGQRISIENIKCSGPDGRIRTLSPINITVR